MRYLILASLVFPQLVFSGVQNLLDAKAHLRLVGTAPTVTANCGTSPTVTGSDAAGKLNVGTGGTATTCTLTFNTTWSQTPSCVVADETSVLAIKGAPSTTTLVITSTVAFTASDVVDYICLQGS